MRAFETSELDDFRPGGRRRGVGAGRRRRWRDVAVRPWLIIAAVLGVLSMFASVVSSDDSLETFAMLLVLSFPLSILATMVLLVFQLVFGRLVLMTSESARREDRLGHDVPDDLVPGAMLPAGALTTPMTAEQRLKRRYVAGELTDAEFQRAVMLMARERYSHGQLSLAEYEIELDRLLQRSRTVAALDGAATPAADSIHT